MDDAPARRPDRSDRAPCNVVTRQQERLVQSLTNSRDDLDAEIDRRSTALMSPPDPVTRPPSPDQVAALTTEDIARWLSPSWLRRR